MIKRKLNCELVKIFTQSYISVLESYLISVVTTPSLVPRYPWPDIRVGIFTNRTTRYFSDIYVSLGVYGFLGSLVSSLRLFRTNSYIPPNSPSWLSPHQRPPTFCPSRDVTLGGLSPECRTPFIDTKPSLHIYHPRSVGYRRRYRSSQQTLLWMSIIHKDVFPTVW